MFPDGFFFIVCEGTKLALDVSGGSMTNDGNIILWKKKIVDNINQLWMHEDGFIINRKSGLVLDIRGGDIKKDKSIIQYTRKPGLPANQLWSHKDGAIFPTSSPHLVLDVKGDEGKENANVILGARDATRTLQRWILEPFENERTTEDLRLLRPPAINHEHDTPRPEEICNVYQRVCLEKKTNPSKTEIAGAMAFKGLKIYIVQQKGKNEPLVTQNARQTIQQLVEEEVQKFLAQQDNLFPSPERIQLVRTAQQAAISYFSREYEL